MLHDIGWPLARRDAYYAPERIPAEHRRPLARDTYLLPEEPGTATEGMPFACVAAREGGPRNGILTAVEDFLAGRPELEFAKVPAFFGFGVIWHPDAAWAADVALAVGPWDKNPVLERMEANRILHMVERYRMTRLLERSVDRGERERRGAPGVAGIAGVGRRRAALAPARTRPPRVHARPGAARSGRRGLSLSAPRTCRCRTGSSSGCRDRATCRRSRTRRSSRCRGPGSCTPRSRNRCRR